MARKRSGKRRKNHGRNAKIVSTKTVIITIIVGVVLIFGLATDVDFAGKLQDIFVHAVEQMSGRPSNRATQEIADLELHGDKLIIYAVDTGNSDCLIVRAPEGNAMMVDAADSDDLEDISATLRALDIPQLDAVVATHADSDHIGSMADIIKRFNPAVIYMPHFAKDTATYKNLQDIIDKSDIKQVYAMAPLEFALGSVHIKVLNPQQEEYEKANDSSVVLLLTYGESRALLTGDIETKALNDLLSQYPEYLDVDVLKIAHHGSARSTTQEFLDATTPDIAIITAGKGNDYGHPHKETIEKLDENNVTTLRTDQDGDIAVLIEKDAISYAAAA